MLVKMRRQTLLRHLENIWNGIRFFSFKNRSVSEFVFILLYAIEQLTLVLFVSLYKESDHLPFIASIFAIIVLTTFALHKLAMDSRIKLLEERVRLVVKEKAELEIQNKYFHDEYDFIVGKYPHKLPKGLNNSKII